MKYTLIFIIVLGAASAADRSPVQQAPPRESSRVNPYREQRSAEQAGRKLYQRECAQCHGQAADGSRFAPPLATAVVRHAPDGAIDWVLRNGSLGRGMPSFAHMPSPQRWQIITYLKSLQF